MKEELVKKMSQLLSNYGVLEFNIKALQDQRNDLYHEIQTIRKQIGVIDGQTSEVSQENRDS